MSPSTGVKTGSIARPMPAVAARATIVHCRLSRAASVQMRPGRVPLRDLELRRLLHRRDQLRAAKHFALLPLGPASTRAVLVDHIPGRVHGGYRGDRLPVPVPIAA